MSKTDSPIKMPDRFFIGGEWVAPSSNARFDVLEAATEKLYFRVALAAEADMQGAISAARRAFDFGPWPRMGHLERAEYLRSMADEFERRKDVIGDLWTSESGLLRAHASAAVRRLPDVFRYYADLADDYPFEERHQPTAGGKVGLLAREPVGVVGAIVAWNGPISQIVNKTAPALLAGCTLIVKPSPEAPGAGYILAEVAEAVGLPPGVVNCVTADRDVSELLVDDPRVDKISFTGSSGAGRRIGSICGARIARVTLELGGKSAAIVLDDYDLETAAKSLSASATLCTGQTCAALTRIIVERHRHDDLVDALSASFSAVKVGDPFDPGIQMGPLASARQRDRVEGFIAEGRSEGSILATGGGRPTDLEHGYFIEPTVFGNVDNGSTIGREEIFGPVLSVIPADDERHAVDLANDSIYGLNASVFTNDVDRALSIARQLRSGTVGHNAFRSDLGIAFGGFKQSGLGREGGREGLLPFLEVKTIILEDEPHESVVTSRTFHTDDRP